MENNFNNDLTGNVSTNNNISANASEIENTVVVPVVESTKNVDEKKKSYKTLYILIGVFVGFVLLVAVILLYFLLNGDIENRNRLTCTRTTQEEGYNYSIQRYYTFEDKKMVRVYYTYVFDFVDELTDDLYNETFEEVINMNNNVGSTKYGLATTIERGENLVKITSYEPNYFNEFFDDVNNFNKKEGYTCE